MEDEYDIELKNQFGCLFNHKRILLPSIIILPLMLIDPIFRNYFYLFFCCFVSVLIVGFNFPILSTFAYSKPIYFDDLNDDKSENKIVKNRILYNIGLSKKFKEKFVIFQLILFSITLSLMFDYLHLKYKNKQYHTVEFLAFVGGILSFHSKIVIVFGKGFLQYLYYKKKKEKEELLERLNMDINTMIT